MMKRKIKLSEYAKLNGICYRTAWNRYHSGLIESAEKSKTGCIYVNLDESKPDVDMNVVYARVSTSAQRKDLETQVDRIVEFSNARGLKVDKVYKEIASGLNDKRPKLQEILDNKRITTIVVENKDRLTRFGFNHIETLLNQRGCKILIMNEFTNDKEDLIQDFVSVITSFCAKIYSRRRSRNNVKQILESLGSN